MKVALGIAVLLLGGIGALWAMGYTVHVGNGYVDVVGPTRVSPSDAEASANSAECIGLKERFPEKPYYTMEELDARSKATLACIEAKTKYIRNKERGR